MDFRNLMVFDASRGRTKAIELKNGLELSVQVGPSNYCEPRATLRDIGRYTSMEIAILDKDGLRGPEGILPDHLADLFEAPTGCVVAGYVPIDKIQEIFDYLMR